MAPIIASRRLAEAGRLDEAVFWYYVGQLRGRMEAAADPTAAEAYGAIFATVGPGINEYAMASIPKFVAMVDKVLAWDASHPKLNIEPAERAKQRKGLADLKAHVLKNQDHIRQARTKNGLANDPA